MKHILLTQAEDQPGLIAKVTHVCHEHGLNIIRNDEFVDKESGQFFMRTELSGDMSRATLLFALSKIRNNIKHKIVEEKKKQIVVFCTKESHCLGKILMDSLFGDLQVEVKAVISNHDDLRSLVSRFGIPYHHVSSDRIERTDHEKRLLMILNRYEPDFIVLAKYMRVLTPTFISHYTNRIINIHHSFLPAFAGSKPYHQAYERGVKMIGATAHIVNSELDGGPIIEQGVEHIDHRLSAADMVKTGREIEARVLTKSIDKFLKEKVFVYQNKTVVFD